MRIENSYVQMAGASSSLKVRTREESLKVWLNQGQPRAEGQTPAETIPAGEQEWLELSDQARAMLAGEKNALRETAAGEELTFEVSHQDKVKMRLFEIMMEKLTGKKFRFYLVERIKIRDGGPGESVQPRQAAAQVSPGPGWGLEYHRRETYYEQEKLSFSARGVVRTADGREINFSVDLNMSREFAAEHNFSLRAGQAALDPLVINFDGTAPGLTDSKFSFDLDCDGHGDQISSLLPGSGFLALDLNGDGRVNDGRELFGPRSGDGFADLAEYDRDGNLWIDENDAIFHRLRIWTRDEEGNEELMALGQKGIGAIFLGNLTTPFSMKDNENQLQGEVSKSGLGLKEDGTAVTVQQIDLAV